MGSILQYLGSLHSDGVDATDAELVTRFVERQEQLALEALLRRHGAMGLGRCRRILRDNTDAEDAFQATFIVLARRAGSIQPRSKVGNWLYGVAYRTAMRLRRDRQRHEQKRETLSEVTDDSTGKAHLSLMLDEELMRLPDKYRTVILMCDLQGWTREEAARQLNWPEGTVAGRLARARKLLAKNLRRDGFALVAGLSVALSGSACFAVTPTLHAQTLKVSSLDVGNLSGPVFPLATKVMKAMTRQKVRTLLLNGALLGGLMASLVYLCTQATAGENEKSIDPGLFQFVAQKPDPTKPPKRIAPKKIVESYLAAGFRGDQKEAKKFAVGSPSRLNAIRDLQKLGVQKIAIERALIGGGKKKEAIV